LGEPALSDFRKRKLIRRISELAGAGHELESRFVYLIESGIIPGQSEIQALQELLHGDPVTMLDPEGLLLVVPRMGTQSPWSTKATDIARHCGLQNVIRIERGIAYRISGLAMEDRSRVSQVLHDRMTQSVLDSLESAHQLFQHNAARPLNFIPVSREGAAALRKADRDLGLALSEDEITYLVSSFGEMNRDPSDAELMMFAQANSEHCRHKIFNSDWKIDG
jgi:phosphoribosylformylglycinamidine synthase